MVCGPENISGQWEVRLRVEKKEKEGRLEFRADECKDIIWVPLYDIGDRRYHVYWKSK